MRWLLVIFAGFNEDQRLFEALSYAAWPHLHPDICMHLHNWGSSGLVSYIIKHNSEEEMKLII